MDFRDLTLKAGDAAREFPREVARDRGTEEGEEDLITEWNIWHIFLSYYLLEPLAPFPRDMDTFLAIDSSTIVVGYFAPFVGDTWGD